MASSGASPNLYEVNVQGSGVAIGDRAQIIQHIGTVYNISQSGPTRITPSLKASQDRMLDEHKLFGGRDQELQQLNTFISENSSGNFFVTGASGFGKSALLINWVKALQTQEQPVCYHFINRWLDLADKSFTLKNLCQQLAAYHDMRGDLPESINDLRSLYALLLRIPPEEGKRIVIVLDGLDEATDWKVTPDLFRPDLPEGVFVIFSAREVPDRDWIRHLRLAKNTETLRLVSLGILEIADLLRKADEKTARLADDPQFVIATHRVSQGDPFYLRFLVEDIGTEKITVDNIDTQPEGLDEYLDEWWNQLSDDVSIKEIRKLLGILTFARGRLQPSDFAHVSSGLSEDVLPLEELERKLGRYLTGNRTNGYAISHPRFNDYLRRKRFIYKNENHQYQEQLLNYCRRWPEHQSQYALSHYAGHLADAHYKDELYSLISESWLQIQFARVYSHRAFADDVELAITTAKSETPPNLVQVACNCLISATLGSLATKVPPEILGAMARVGQASSARDYASLMQDGQQQVQSYMLIYEALLARKSASEAQVVLNLALTGADKLEDKVIKTRTLSSIAQTLTRFKNSERAVEVAHNARHAAQSIDDKIAKARALSSVAQALAQAGQFDSALAIVESLEDETTKGSALNSLALTLERPEDLDCVQLASANLEDKLAKIKVWSSIAQVCAQHGNMERAASIAYNALEVARAITSQENNAPSLNVVAQTCAWARDLRGVLTIVDAITDKQLKAEVLSAAAQVFVQNKDRENAIRMAENAWVEARSIKERQSKAGVLSNIVQTLAYAREFSRASDIADKIEDRWSKSSAINSIVQGMIQEAYFEKAIEVTDRIDDALLKAPALGSIASALALDSQFKRARDIVNMIKDEQAKLDALTDVAQAVAQTGEVKTATEIINRALTMMDAIKPELAKVLALSSVAQALIQSGQVERAITIVKDAWEIAQLIAEQIEKAPALSSVAHTLALTRQFDLALMVAQEIDDEGAKASALSSIAQTLTEMGECEQAANVANLALASALALQDKWSSVIALSGVAQTLISLGDYKRATEIVNRAFADIEVVEDEQLKTSALSSVVQTLILLQQFDPALAAPAAIQPELANEWILGDVAQAQAKIGDWRTAQATTTQIKNMNYKAQTLSSIAQTLAKQGQTEKAAEIAKDVVKLLEIISDGRTKAQSLRSIAQALGFVNESEVLERARSVAEAITHEGFKVLGLSSVAQAFILAKQYEQATDAVITAFCTARLAGREIVFQVLESTATTLAMLHNQDQVSYLWPIYEKIVEVERWWQNPKYHMFIDYSNKGGKQA